MISRPYPYVPFEKPLPAPPIQSGGAICLEIDAKWFPYIYGLLLTLCVERTWANDVARATGEASLLIDAFTNAEICRQAVSEGTEGDDCMGCCLRFQDGKLQILSCGVWTDVEGQPAGGLQQPDQPGQTTPPPPPGECAQWRVVVPAHGSVLLPAVVNTGDVLHVFDFAGATTEVGDIGRWNCQDGLLFYDGVCVPLTDGTDGANLSPTLKTGQVMWKIGSSYYDALSPLTVPGGVSNQQAALLINYSPGGTYEGEITCQVEKCNNQSTGFTHTFDFAVSTAGFTPTPQSEGPGCTAAGAVWTAGVGWTPFQCPSIGAEYINVGISFAVRNLTSVTLTFESSEASPPASGLDIFYNHGGTEVHECTSVPPWTPTFTIPCTPTGPVQGMRIRVGIDDLTDNMVLRRIVISGDGSDPF